MPDPESATAAQIARVLTNHGHRVDPRDIVASGVGIESEGTSPLLATYELVATVIFHVEITFAEYQAISTPIDLQPLSPAHIHEWTPGMLAEYRRQYDAKMRLPQPPLIIHPDEVDRWWTAIHS